MSERSEKISNLQNNETSRTAYIKAKLSVLIPSQIRAMRLKSENLSRQADLARATGMKQSRISAMETPGAVNFNLETLVRLASIFKVGLLVKFVPFSEMLRWENSFSQDDFSVTQLDDDEDFLIPNASVSTFQLFTQTNSIKIDSIFRRMAIGWEEISEYFKHSNVVTFLPSQKGPEILEIKSPPLMSVDSISGQYTIQ
jgi:transcriptional regulator with XRE-family HTH domain